MPDFRKPAAKKVLLCTAIIVVLVAAGCAWGKVWIGKRIESALVDQLSKRELVFSRASSSWDPWRGLHFEKARVVYPDGNQPLVEAGSLNIGFSVLQYLTNPRDGIAWKFHASAVLLTDAKGSVTLDKLGAKIETSPGKVRISRLDLRAGGIVADLTGTVLFDPPPKSAPPPFTLDLAAARGTLAVLDMPRDGGKFHIGGSFAVDRRTVSPRWTADLAGHGRGLIWQGVRCQELKADAALSSGENRIAYELTTAHGSTRGEVTSDGWNGSPFGVTGTLTDSAGESDDYRATYRDRIWTVESFKGRADLLALSADLITPPAQRPDNVKFQKFPMIDLRDATRSTAGAWSIKSLKATAGDLVTLAIEGCEVKLGKLSVAVSLDDSGWRIDDCSAAVMGGSVTVAGRYHEGVFRKAKVEVEDIRLADLKDFLGDSGRSKHPGVLAGNFNGVIDPTGKRSAGSGSLRLEKAPVYDIPLLVQVYEIFEAVIPGMERSGEGRFEARYRLDGETVGVTRFEASGGSLEVSAVGTVDLKTSRVSGKARGKLNGLPGVLTSPLSRLLEMEVAGPIGKIRIQPLGPAKLASNAASGVVGTPVDAVEEAAKITGTVLTEGVKLPFRWLDKDDPPDEKK